MEREMLFLNSHVYLRGAAWFVLVSVISALNDTFVKLSGTGLGALQVTFFRFFFGMVTLLPFMLRGGIQSFKTPYVRIHATRSLFLFLAIMPWSYGVIQLPLPLVTTISFTTPIFVLVLSRLFLKERIGLGRVLATAVGFLGIVVSAQPGWGGVNASVFILVLSTILFASLDIINKKQLIKDESLLHLLFFSALGTTLLCLPFALANWVTPSWGDLGLLLCLGAGGNLILFCLLKAFQACELSSLQPLRYTELLFSMALSFVVFGQLPSSSTLWGAAFIIPATFYIAYHEVRRPKSKPSQETSLDEAATPCL
jgi:S-adenosylmethionine uptake transporter